MAIIDNYNLYSMNVQNKKVYELDEVQSHIAKLKKIEDFEEVSNYITENFGDVKESIMLEFPEINKQMSILKETDKIEVCAALNRQQIFGKGWKIIKDKE